MKLYLDKRGDSAVAVIQEEELRIRDVAGALDLMATVSYEQGCTKIALYKENIDEAFFDLRTKLAGEILQKYTNYGMQLAIIGDFRGYESKSLRDFIYESNRGGRFLFVGTLEEALDRLHS